MASLTFKPVTLDVSHGDEEAMLVYRGDRLAAVVTRLGVSHEEAAGRWFIESSFSDEHSALHKTFGSLAEIEARLSDEANQR